MPSTPQRVSSDLYSPLIGALYLALLPIWLLLFVTQLGSGAGIGPTTFVYGLLVAVSVPQFFYGLGLLRQRVEADADGVRLTGLGGFDVTWEQVASVSAQPARRASNVVVALIPGTTVASEYLVGRVGRRRFGVAPECLEPLLALASAHGVGAS